MFLLRKLFRKNDDSDSSSLGPSHATARQQCDWLDFDLRDTALSWALFADKFVNKDHDPDGRTASTDHREDDQSESDDTLTESEDDRVDSEIDQSEHVTRAASEDGEIDNETDRSDCDTETTSEDSQSDSEDDLPEYDPQPASEDKDDQFDSGKDHAQSDIQRESKDDTVESEVDQFEDGTRATSENSQVNNKDEQPKCETLAAGDDDWVDSDEEHSEGDEQIESTDDRLNSEDDQPDRDVQPDRKDSHPELDYVYDDYRDIPDGSYNTQNENEDHQHESELQTKGQPDQVKSDKDQPEDDGQVENAEDQAESDEPGSKDDNTHSESKDRPGKGIIAPAGSEVSPKAEDKGAQAEIGPHQAKSKDHITTPTTVTDRSPRLTESERLLLRWRSEGLDIETMAKRWRSTMRRHLSTSVIAGKLTTAGRKAEYALAVKKAESGSAPTQAVNGTSGANHGPSRNRPFASFAESLDCQRFDYVDGQNNELTNNESEDVRPQCERYQPDQPQGTPSDLGHMQSESQPGRNERSYLYVLGNDGQAGRNNAQNSNQDVQARPDDVRVGIEDDQAKTSQQKTIITEPEPLTLQQADVEATKRAVQRTDESEEADLEETSTDPGTADRGHFLTRHVWNSRLHFEHLKTVSDAGYLDRWDPAVPSFYWEDPFNNALFEHYSVAVAYPDCSTNPTTDTTPRSLEPFEAANRDFRRLRKVLELFEPRIMKKWMETPRPQRLSLLKKCWSEMFRDSEHEIPWPEDYHPEYQIGDPELEEPGAEAIDGGSLNGGVRTKIEAAGGDEEEEYAQQISRGEKAYLSACFQFPMISSDLKEGNNFLQLLKSRGRNEPACFEFRDVELLNRARSWRCLSDNYFYDQTVQDGWAISWAPPGKPRSILHFREEDRLSLMSIPASIELSYKAMAVVASQQCSLLGFLFQMCAEILDLTTQDLDSALCLITSEVVDEPQLPALSSKQKKRLAAQEEATSWCPDDRESLYGVPKSPDFHSLQARILARAEMAKDTLKTAREEPHAFAEVLEEARECSYWNVPGPKCTFEGARSARSEPWNQVFSLLMVPAAAFDDIGTYLKVFLNSMKRRADSSHYVSDFEHYSFINNLWDVVESYQVLLVELLHDVLPGGPRMRGNFLRGEDELECTGSQWAYDPLLQALTPLMDKNGQKDGYVHLIGRLMPLLRDLEHSKKLPQCASQLLQDLSLLTELELAIKNYQPLFLGYQRAQLHGWLMASPPRTANFVRDVATIFDWGNLSQRRLHHGPKPDPQRPSVPAVQRLMKAETELDAIWDTFEARSILSAREWSGENGRRLPLNKSDMPREQVCSLDSFGTLKNFWHSYLDIKRTRLPTEDAEIKHSPTKRLLVTPATPESIQQPFFPTSHESNKKRTLNVHVKGKLKKRPAVLQPPALPTPTGDDHVPNKEEEPDRTIYVDKAAMATAQSLFGGDELVPNTLTFNDLAHLLDQMGFTRIKTGKASGSAVTCAPYTEDAKRIFKGYDACLHFHTPHPLPRWERYQIFPKIRHMKRTLGLNIDMFVLGKRPASDDA